MAKRLPKEISDKTTIQLVVTKDFHSKVKSIASLQGKKMSDIGYRLFEAWMKNPNIAS